MSRTKLSKLFLILLLTISLSCKDSFEARVPGQDVGFLVVEGYINVGSNAITAITLSRTTPIAESSNFRPETGANVFVEDEDGNSVTIYEKGNGVYHSKPVSLSVSKRVRIVIFTTDGKRYSSLWEQPIVSPQIDSITWKRVDAGVSISVSTHDASDQTRYYQWDFEETWELSSAFFSLHAYSNGSIVPRPVEETLKMKTCWKYEHPKDLITASTAASDVNAVSGKELVMIAVGDERLSEKYSILVRQHTLSREAYDYLQLIKKNTDDVGSFFDPQPSEIYGNLHCETANEPVVGYIGAYTTSEQRIFIEKEDVPDWNLENCRRYLVINHKDSLEKYFNLLRYNPTGLDIDGGNFYAAPARCTDCRIRGGNNNKPDFWE